MERKHKLYDHPYLGAFVAFVIIFFVTQGVASVLALPLLAYNIMEDVSTAGFLLAGILSFVALLIHRMWFRKDHYKGCFTLSNTPNKDVWIGIIISVVMTIVFILLDAMTRNGDGPKLILPSVASLITAFYAGAFEETLTRAVPVSIMMKNNPDRKRMLIAAIASALAFGFLHISNVTVGASLAVSIIQAAAAICTGLFYVAVYLRTGSILFSMLIHAGRDILAFMSPEQSTGVMLQGSLQGMELFTMVAGAVIELAIAIYLLRKTKWDDIKATWANIWAE